MGRVVLDPNTGFETHLLRWAVLGMLPKNKLRVIYANRLKIFAGAAHMHEEEIGDKRSIV